MSDQPLVSIIIPTHNRAHLIGETLDSVLAQTYLNWECIIVDDGSSDNTDEVVGEYTKKDTRFKYYHRTNEHLPGGNGARNYGFKMSQGEYVNWFDSDDLMIDAFMENHVRNLDSDRADVSICDLNLFITNTDIRKKWLSDDWKNCNFKNFCEGYIMFRFGLGILCFMWRKRILNGKELFSESLKRSQEYEFFSRIFLLSQPKISKCSKVLVLYRQHENNKLIQIKSGETDKVISGLLAKKMVIEYLKQSISISSKLQVYFIADALTYLQYDIKELKNYVSVILKEMNVANINRLVSNYIMISKYTGFIKIKRDDIELLQKKVPLFLLIANFKVYLKIKKLFKKIIQNLKKIVKA
jgi:glycosyltransferase involved in cell wall biosynthesis